MASPLQDDSIRFKPLDIPKAEVRAAGIGLFDAIFEESLAPIFLLDLDLATHTLTIGDCNLAALRILGLERKDKHELMGRNILSLFTRDGLADAQGLRRALIRHQAFTGEGQLRGEDGSPMACRLVFRPFGGRGTPLRYIAIIHPLSAHLEVQVEALTAELMAARTARERMLARLSHDLRTPLNGILGLSEILQNPALVQLDEQTRAAYARDIHSAGRELLFRIEDMLAAALADDPQRYTLEETKVHLEALVRRVAKRFFDAKDVGRILFAVEAGIGPVLADEELVEKMTEALFDNALRAAPADTPIRCRIGRTQDGGVYLAIEDHGMPLELAEVERAIAALEEESDVYSAPSRRLTAGLPMAKAYIELHGGRMELGPLSGPSAPSGGAKKKTKAASGHVTRLIFPPNRYRGR